MVFPMRHLVGYASSRFRLVPGDLVLSGSPAGNAAAHGGAWLKAGDVMEAELTFLGRQRNELCRRAADGRAARQREARLPPHLGQHALEAVGVTDPLLPEAARWVDVDPAKGYVVEEIADGLHWVSDGPYQAMFLVEREGVTLVDAPPSLGGRLLDAIRRGHRPAGHASSSTRMRTPTTSRPRRCSIARRSSGTARRRACSSARRDPRRPVPSVLVRRRARARRPRPPLRGAEPPSGQPVRARAAARTLMVVDVVYHGWAPYKSLGLPKDVPGWIDAHDTMLALRLRALRQRPQRPARHAPRRRGRAGARSRPPQPRPRAPSTRSAWAR